MSEYIGYKDPIGNGLFNMGLTDEEIVRCRDCKDRAGKNEAGIAENHCFVFDFITEPDCFCAWGEKR